MVKDTVKTPDHYHQIEQPLMSQLLAIGVDAIVIITQISFGNGYGNLALGVYDIK